MFGREEQTNVLIMYRMDYVELTKVLWILFRTCEGLHLNYSFMAGYAYFDIIQKFFIFKLHFVLIFLLFVFC